MRAKPLLLIYAVKMILLAVFKQKFEVSRKCGVVLINPGRCRRAELNCHFMAIRVFNCGTLPASRRGWRGTPGQSPGPQKGNKQTKKAKMVGCEGYAWE